MSTPAATSPKFVDYLDASKIKAAQAAQGPGGDGRTVLGERAMTSLLMPASFTTQTPNSVSRVQPPMYGPSSGGGGEGGGDGPATAGTGWVMSPYVDTPAGGFGGTPVWGGDDSKLIRQFNAGEFRGPDGKTFKGVDTPAGQDPNGTYAQYAADDGGGFQNPTGNGGDRVAPIYKIDAKGNGTPVSAGTGYTPSWWVSSGRDLAKMAAIAGTAAFGGAALAGLGEAGAGAAGAAEAAGAAGESAGAAGLADAAAGTAGASAAGESTAAAGLADAGAAGAASGGGLSSADAAALYGNAGYGSTSPSLLQSMGTGALRGAAMNGGRTALSGGSFGDIAKSAAIGGVTGGVGGAVSAYNPMAQAGFDSPGLQTVGNGAIRGGLNAAVTGGSLAGGAIGGAVGGATNAASGAAGDYLNTQFGGQTGTNIMSTITSASQVAPGIASAFQNATGMSVQDAISKGGSLLTQLSAMVASNGQRTVANQGVADSQAASGASARTAAEQMAFARQQAIGQQPQVDALNRQALATGTLNQQAAQDQAARAGQQWDANQKSVAPAVQQIGLNALGAQNLSAEQAAQLQQLQQTLASPGASAGDKAAAQAQIQGLQKTAESNAIGLQNANADRINTVAQGQGAQVSALGEANAQQIGANATASADALNASGAARMGEQSGFYDGMGQRLLAVAKQRGADYERDATTRTNADIETSAGDAQRQLLRLNGDPNRMAAMSTDIANNQQLARISGGNQVAATNIANLNSADDAARGLNLAGFNAGTAQKYAQDNQALSIKSSALDAARASRTLANQTAQGIVSTGQNAATGIQNNAKATVDANTNELQKTAVGMGAGLTGSGNAATQTGTAASSAGISGLNTAAQAPVPMTNALTSAGNGTFSAGNSINQGLADQNLGASASAAAQGKMASAVNKGVTGLADLAPQISKGVDWLTNKIGGTGLTTTSTSPTYGSGSTTNTDQPDPSSTEDDPMSSYMSSKMTKKNFQAVDGDAVLDGLAAAQPKAYSYKAGKGDGGAHIGPMAEDMQQQFGNRVAPGGKKIDVISQLGLSHVAINALTKRVKQLEGRA